MLFKDILISPASPAPRYFTLLGGVVSLAMGTNWADKKVIPLRVVLSCLALHSTRVGVRREAPGSGHEQKYSGGQSGFPPLGNAAVFQIWVEK